MSAKYEAAEKIEQKISKLRTASLWGKRSVQSLIASAIYIIT